jgi:hypothetical protein
MLTILFGLGDGAGHHRLERTRRPRSGSNALVSEGGGLRLTFADAFILRADVGVSAADGYTPGVYIDIDNLF